MEKVNSIDNEMMSTMVKVKIEPELQIESDNFDDEMSAIQPTFEVKTEPNVKAEKIEDYDEGKSIDQPKWEIVVATNRWLQTVRFGSVVEGSPFVPFKMPFVGTDLQPCPPESRFDIFELLKAFPNIGLIVDLSNKLRTYRVSDLMAFGVEYVNIPVKLIPRNEVPNDELLKIFIDTCSRYITKNSGKLIGVHDLLGNRATGYMICKALENLGFSMQQAMNRFKIARGVSIDPVLAGVLVGRGKQWISQSELRRLRKGRKSTETQKQRKVEWKAENNKFNYWQRPKLDPERFETHKSCIALPFIKQEFP